MDVPIPENDAERVAAHGTYNIMGTPPEMAYDDITELAAQICRSPVALIGMIDKSREWLTSKYGLPPELTEVPRDMTICSTTICMTDMLVVPDLKTDERFSENPNVAGEPHFRFYCGMPLINPEGYALGSLCVLDFEARELSFEQTEALRRLSHQVMAQLELRRNLVELQNAHQQLERAREQIEAEKSKSDQLLLNILPEKIAEELKQHDRVEPRFYDSATILFTDFKGFTKFAESMEPARLIDQLDQYFSKFDEITEGHRLEKLKTIGDAYMCVGGLPEVHRRHPIDACLAALEIQDYMETMNRQREKLRLAPWELRLGIHTGPVMAGVVGKKKFTYDIWGDSVNVAARMESAGSPGRINISEYTQNLVKDFFEIEFRGSVEAKNKGELNMYYLNRLKPEFSRDEPGHFPNDRFKEACERVSPV